MTAHEFSPAGPSPATILGHYHLHFAQRPRGTRDRALLGTLINALSQVSSERPPDEYAVPEAERLATLAAWQTELAAIEQEQARLGEAGQAVIWQVDKTRLVLARVARVLDAFDESSAFFSLQPLLRDLSEAKEHLARAHVVDCPEDVAALKEQISTQLSEACEAVKRRERDAAAQLERAAADTLSLARTHVRAAQWLMERFDHLISGRSQLVVRPALLEHMADDLSQRAAALEQLRGGVLDSDEHKQNYRALAEHSQSWLEESRGATLLRRQRTPDELAHALAQEADDVLAATSALPAHERGQRVASWRHLCDRMDELWRQLDGMSLLYGMSAHRNTEAGLTDCLAYMAAPWSGTRV